MIVPKYTREIPQRYRLEAAQCDQCANISFPPRLVCAECGNRTFTQTKLETEGKILTYTIIHVAAEVFAKQTPFAVAIIETKDGVRLTAQVVDCKAEEIEIGKTVKLILRCLQREGHAGILQYGYKAVLER